MKEFNVELKAPPPHLPPESQTPTTTTTTTIKSSLYAYREIILVASIAIGILFGWALQLSLLTPYVQLLGIPHTYASLIWLCGPISGLIVQPLVGYYSDRCTSRFGRRRPFIASGAALVLVAAFLIGFAADIGAATGDPDRPPVAAAAKTAKPRAIAVFVVGFWILDVANNMLMGPCRALLADLSGTNQKMTRVANSFFAFCMAVGNVLGYAAGSYGRLYRIFPFTKTDACDVYCANLKSCLFISVALLCTFSAIAVYFVSEKPLLGKFAAASSELSPPQTSCKKIMSKVPFFGELFSAVGSMKRPMVVLLMVNMLNWGGWFPFFLYDTDWMGKEVYGGDANGTEGAVKVYANGVRAGAVGLILNSVVLGLTSVGTESVGRLVGGAKRLWGVVNIFLAFCMVMTVVVSKLAESGREYVAGGDHAVSPSAGIRAGALLLFAVLGTPLAVTYSVPFALTAAFANESGSGLGLSMGVLNISTVIPQLIVSLLSGPWDSLFGGGNLPAFVVGAVAAACSGVLALTLLPSPPPEAVAGKVPAGGFH